MQAYIEGKDVGFKLGLIAGITAFAHWKDGEQYVGTCGTKLSEVLKQIRESTYEEVRHNWGSWNVGENTKDWK